MATKDIMPAVAVKVIKARVSAFNDKYLSTKKSKYCPRIKGKFIYMMRTLDDGGWEHVCRLTYSGNLKDLDFAIYRYTIKRYDPKEWCFPGSEFVDGTLEGAMKAGLKAYPV